MEIDSISSVGTVVGSGFFGGLLLGYAFKKVVKLIAVIAGLFISGLAYLQYQQLATFKWDSIEGTIASLANTAINSFDEFWYSTYHRYVSRFCDWLHEGIIKDGY
jgi:uncharacterized membrane protein (Fun14 family)